MYYPCSENKDADQLKLICVFVFAHANCWFSHAQAHIQVLTYEYIIYYFHDCVKQHQNQTKRFSNSFDYAFSLV